MNDDLDTLIGENEENDKNKDDEMVLVDIEGKERMMV